MWRSVRTTEEKSYVLKREAIGPHGVKLVASDMIHVWVKEITNENLLNTFQELNPLLEEFTPENIWTYVDNHLESGEKDNESSCYLHLCETENHNSLHFKFFKKLDGLSLRLDILLLKENSTSLYNEVTSPLLTLVNCLLAQQERLFYLLEKKDLEISQYKLEGAILSRRNIQTEIFNKDNFLSGLFASGNKGTITTKVVNSLNLISNKNSESSDNPNKSTDSSQDVPCQDDISIEAEDKASHLKEEVKTAGYKVSKNKKKRTKLNI